MMASFMRYCVRSRLTAEGCRAAMVSISVRSSPPFRASGHFTVGGSWRWSPARMPRPAFWMAIQQEASSAWAASVDEQGREFLTGQYAVGTACQRAGNDPRFVEQAFVDGDFQFGSPVAQAGYLLVKGFTARRRAAGVQVADGFADGPGRGKKDVLRNAVRR